MANSLSLGERDLDGQVALIKSLTSDKKVLKSLEDFLKDAEKLAQGKPSPKFIYKDIKGKEVKLEDLKGTEVRKRVPPKACLLCKYFC